MLSIIKYQNIFLRPFIKKNWTQLFTHERIIRNTNFAKSIAINIQQYYWRPNNLNVLFNLSIFDQTKSNYSILNNSNDDEFLEDGSERFRSNNYVILLPALAAETEPGNKITVIQRGSKGANKETPLFLVNQNQYLI
jgi:hypothetical protein